MATKNLLALIFVSLLCSQCTGQNSHWSVLKTFHIRSSGSWDYITVSPLADLLYVSHGTQVNILNRSTGDSVGVIGGTIGVHGITFAPELGKGFISNGRLDNVFVFDAKSNRVTDSIHTGTNPDAMCYDHYSGLLVVGNGKSKDISIINAKVNKVISTIPLGGKPEASVSNEKGKVFVNVEDKNEVAVIDMKTLSIIARYPLEGGEEPAGLAYDTKTETLFVGCGNRRLVLLDAVSGKQKSTLPIGDHCDGVAFDAGTRNAFASNGDGTLTVINGNNKSSTFSVVANVTTTRSARTLAVDERTHLIYLPAADFEADSKPGERPKMKPGSFRVIVVGQH